MWLFYICFGLYCKVQHLTALQCTVLNCTVMNSVLHCFALVYPTLVSITARQIARLSCARQGKVWHRPFFSISGHTAWGFCYDLKIMTIMHGPFGCTIFLAFGYLHWTSSWSSLLGLRYKSPFWSLMVYAQLPQDWATLGQTGQDWTILDHHWLNWARLGQTGLNLARLGKIGTEQDKLGQLGPAWTDGNRLGLTGPCWYRLGQIWPDWAILWQTGTHWERLDQTFPDRARWDQTLTDCYRPGGTELHCTGQSCLAAS